jgi:2-dehydropantoate 2-reductase
MSAIRRRGLSIGGIWGEHLASDLEAHTSVSQVPKADFDLVLITTKAYDTERAIDQALPRVGAHTLVASLQNGLGNVESIAARVGAERTLGARLMFGAELVGPGRVEVTVQGGELMLGSPTGCIPPARIEEVARTFSQAGIAAQSTDQIKGFLWGKMLYNCCLNALSALLEVNYGRLLETDATRNIMWDVIREVFAVAARRQVSLLWSQPEEYRELLFGELIPTTAAHRASMYADLKGDKRTEIDALNGAIARLGEEVGVPTPTCSLLTRIVCAREGLGSQKA